MFYLVQINGFNEQISLIKKNRYKMFFNRPF